MFFVRDNTVSADEEGTSKEHDFWKRDEMTQHLRKDVANGGGRYERLHTLLRQPRPPIFDDNDMPGYVNVDYGQRHPFERRVQQIPLDDDNARLQVQYTLGEAEYQPIRIRFVTEPLERMRGARPLIDAQIDIIMHVVCEAGFQSVFQSVSNEKHDKHLTIIVSSCAGTIEGC